MDQFAQLVITLLSIAGSGTALIAAISLLVRATSKHTEARAALTTAQAASLAVNSKERELILTVAAGHIATTTRLHEIESKNTEYLAQIKALNANIETQNAKIESLTKELEVANKEVLRVSKLLDAVTLELKAANDKIAELLLRIPTAPPVTFNPVKGAPFDEVPKISAS